MTHPSMTTICIGRLLMDLPTDAQAAIRANYQRIDSQTPVRVHDFAGVEQKLTQRAKEYKAVTMHRTQDDDRGWRRSGYDPDSLYATTQLIGFKTDSALQQAVLGYHPEPDSPNVMAELHKVAGRQDYVFKTNGVIGADDYAKAQGAMWAIGSTFQPLVRGSTPQGPGFCVEGGMFADSGRLPVRESFTLVVTFADHPDVRFVIDANAIDRVNEGEPSLKHRVDGELGILRAGVRGHVGVLERGSLTVAEQDGYQIAVSAPYDVVPNTRLLKFFWSADGVPNDVTHPFMEIDMTVQPTNDGQSTIRDDDEAKELWKQLMQGIRIRPGAV